MYKYVIAFFSSILLSATTFNGSLLPQKAHATDLRTDVFTDQKRPPFTLPDLSGEKQDIKKWDGQVIIVNFWATWCGPCKQEIQVFNQLQADYSNENVQFVGIAIDDDKAVKRFLEQLPIEYPVLIADDTGIKLSIEYGNIAGALPYTVFIGRDGTIETVASGGLTKDITQRTIEKLL